MGINSPSASGLETMSSSSAVSSQIGATRKTLWQDFVADPFLSLADPFDLAREFTGMGSSHMTN